MKRPSYRYAIEWIALEDEPTQCEVDVVESYISVQLVSDLFGKPAREVATKVVEYRKKVDQRAKALRASAAKLKGL